MQFAESFFQMLQNGELLKRLVATAMFLL